MKKNYTTKEVAEKVGVTQTTIIKWIQGGFLDASVSQHGMRKRYSISKEAIERLFKKLEKLK